MELSTDSGLMVRQGECYGMERSPRPCFDSYYDFKKINQTQYTTHPTAITTAKCVGSWVHRQKSQYLQIHFCKMYSAPSRAECGRYCQTKDRFRVVALWWPGMAV